MAGRSGSDNETISCYLSLQCYTKHIYTVLSAIVYTVELARGKYLEGKTESVLLMQRYLLYWDR